MSNVEERIRLLLKLYSLLFYTPTRESFEEARSIALALGYVDIVNLLDTMGLELLLREYTRTFHARGSCRPYESYYREGVMYGDTTVSVKRYYESRGYTMAVEGEQADHVAVELEYLSLTLDEEFLDRFLEWFEKLVDDLRRCSEVYHKLGLRLLRELLQWRKGKRKL